MVTIQQFEQGLSDYIDAQLMPKLPRNSLYKILIGTSAAIVIRRAGNAVSSLRSNPIISALGIIDDNSCIDVDVILDELKCQIPDDGLHLESNKFGKFDLVIRPNDVDELHNYIIRRQDHDNSIFRQ